MVANREGKILRKAWEWKLKELLPNKDIVQRLNSMGIKWMSERRLSDVYRNPFYCGKLVNTLLGGEVVIGRHEALATPEDFLMVNEILKGKFNKGKHSIENTIQLPLKRFMSCASCGNPTTGYLQKQKSLYYYKCRTNGCKKNKSQKKLHMQFQDFLKRYEVKKESVAHIEKGLSYMFEQFNRDAKTEQKKYKKNLAAIIQKIEQFELRYVEGEINMALYEKYNQKFLDEKFEMERIMESSTFESSNLKNCINYVSTISRNLTEIWTSEDYSQSERVQQLVFPEGISYDFKNERFLTSRINSLFLPIPYLCKGLEETKKWNNNKEVINSTLVRHTGFEPVTPTLSR
ncbi:MAG: recombinase family protein [Flavobacteriales bacterium]|nr:recombinase family protein [Flavobacteriales bacterium]